MGTSTLSHGMKILFLQVRRAGCLCSMILQKPKRQGRPVTQQDIIDFFVKNMTNENLGPICNAHVVHADRSDYGALDENCLKLAELAALAVDFPKTGKIVTLPQHLKPRLYPDFLGKEDNQSYKSTKILGRLYRKVRDAYDEDAATTSELHYVPSDIPYDMDLEVPGAADFIFDAWEKKCSYDGQLKGLMGQYKVKREEEIVTGHVWSIPKSNSKKQGELKERLTSINPPIDELVDDEKDEEDEEEDEEHMDP
ncbi:hypothetical protein GBA52_001063 [Prunus armeniaca]|nr:hypothetical protein GBA52_001063 [Prunus armeniaca]